jgi:hypothetical protein
MHAGAAEGAEGAEGVEAPTVGRRVGLARLRGVTTIAPVHPHPHPAVAPRHRLPGGALTTVALAALRPLLGAALTKTVALPLLGAGLTTTGALRPLLGAGLTTTVALHRLLGAGLTTTVALHRPVTG